MALDRAFQSAVFYYLSCAPCLDARLRKKRKQEAVRNRAERDLLEQEHPDLYRHPSPSSTNPHWNAEIALGPTLTSRGGKRRAQNTDGRRSKAGRLSTNVSGEPSSVDLSGASREAVDAKWKLRPYQREDEDLWGSTSNFGGSTYAESIARPQTARTRDGSVRLQSFRNPPINDLHPATVTKVNSREEVLWMLQPPPVADVMSGKERASRSRSDSGESRVSPGSALSRQVSHRLVQQRLRTEHGSTPMSRETSSRASQRSTGQRHSQNATTNERDFAIPHPDIIELQKAPVLGAIDRESEDSSAITVLRRRSLAPDPSTKLHPSRISSRPQLSTIASDYSLPAPRPSDPTTTSPTDSKENRPPSIRHSSRDLSTLMPQRSAILVDGESFHMVQHLKPRGTVSRTAAAPEHVAAHGSPDSEDTALSIRPDMFDSWYTPDFELPKWVHEHTKREVRQRWSMDL